MTSYSVIESPQLNTQDHQQYWGNKCEDSVSMFKAVIKLSDQRRLKRQPSVKDLEGAAIISIAAWDPP